MAHHVKESHRFLMTREVAHFQMFQTALDSIGPSFPTDSLQSDPTFRNKYFNTSNGEEYLGGWNDGQSTELVTERQVIEDPVTHVRETNSLLNEVAHGTDRTRKTVQKKNKLLSSERKAEIDAATQPGKGIMSWSVYE